MCNSPVARVQGGQTNLARLNRTQPELKSTPSTRNPASIQACDCTAALELPWLLHHAGYVHADFGREAPIRSSMSANDMVKDSSARARRCSRSGSYLLVAMERGVRLALPGSGDGPLPADEP